MVERVQRKRESYYTVGGNVNWYSHYGEQYEGYLKKTKNIATLWSSENHNLNIDSLRCSGQHYLQKPVHVSNINVHQQRNG